MNAKRWLSVFFVAASSFCATGASADDEGRMFDNRAIRGSYGFSLSGSAYLPLPGVPTPQLVQVAAVGRILADGYGNITEGVRNISINGAHYLQTFTCSYQVFQDGTGTAECFINETRLTETFYVALNANGKEFQFVPTDPGTIVTGVAKRQ